MASDQSTAPTATNVAGWNNVANAGGNTDGNVAYSNTTAVNTIKLSGFGFAIPAGDVVVGIVVEAYCGT